MAAIPMKSWVRTPLSHLSLPSPSGIYTGDRGQCCCTEKSQPECGQNCTQNWAAALMEPSDYRCLHLCENAGSSRLFGAGYTENIFFFLLIFTMENSSFNTKESGAACCRWETEFLFSTCRESTEANMFYWLFWLWIWRIGSIPSDICHLKL